MQCKTVLGLLCIYKLCFQMYVFFFGCIVSEDIFMSKLVDSDRMED